MRSLLVMGVLVLTFFAGYSQITISGKVVDSASGHGIAFSSIALLTPKDSSTLRTTLADSSGRFEIQNIPPGKYVLHLSSVEYGPVYRLVEATVPPGTAMINVGAIPMRRVSSALQAVTVSGERRAVQYTADKVVLQVAGNSLFKTATNVFDIVRKAPGVMENPDGTLLLSGRNPPVIFIDGKPVPMSPEEQQAYLNGLSPDLIESIDIIHNPSARYDAQYKGIIDIKLKRNRALGWLGSISSNFRQNQYALFENNAQLSFKTKQLTYSLRANSSQGTNIHRYTAYQHQANTNYMATNTLNRHGINDLQLQLGVEYAIHKNHSLDISAKTFQSNRDLHSFNTLHFTDSTKLKTVGMTRSLNDADPSQKIYAINVGYDARFGDHRLNVFGSYTTIRNGREEDIQNNDELNQYLMSYWKTALKNNIDLRTVQADYSKQMGKGLLEAGGKFAFITTRNDLRYDTLNQEQKFVPDAGRSNQFMYDEYISAGYLSYEYKHEKYTARVSLRGEHTYTKANAITLGTIQKRDYLTWLPSAIFSYNFNTQERISISFTRRMTRPPFDQLNPFRFYLSPLNYWIGNPFLKASVTSLLNVAYNYKNFNVSLSAGKEEDPMTRYPEYNPITNELQYLGRNLPYRNFASIESGYSFSINKWWKTNNTLGIYYNREKNPYHDVIYEIDVIDYTISGSQVFSLPKGITADISWFYKSKSGNGLYFQKPISYVHLGLQKSWLNGKLNTKLNFYDVFNRQKVNWDFREKAIINNNLRHFFGNKRFVATIVYNFGKANYKSKQSRTIEEERRVSN